MRLGIQAFWPVYGMALFALAALGAHVLAYRKTSRPTSRVVRRFLLAVRLAAVALLLAALARPAVETEQTLERKGRLVLLVDSSRSMSIGDEFSSDTRAPCSRLSRAAGVFNNHADLWKEIRQGYDIIPYAFSRELSPLPTDPAQRQAHPTLGLRADGSVTALGDALRKAANATPPPQAILAVTDGLSNSGLDPLDSIPPGGPPVYTVSVGSPEPNQSTRDVAARGIFAPSQAFQESSVTVLGEFAMTGLEGRTVTVSLLADGEEIDTTEITAKSAETVAEARFTYTPDKHGPVRLELRAQPLPDEIVAVNNSAATFMDVKKGGIKVLYLEGNFRWEAKFIRLALDAVKDIDLRLLIPLTAGKRQIAAALQDPWDVLIIGSIAADTLAADNLAAVADAVSAGRAVLFLGGPKGLGRGGYASGPAAPLVPFTLESSEKYDECLYLPDPKPLGPHASVVELGPPDNPASWQSVSPLPAVNLVGKPRPGASVLLAAKPRKLDPSTGSLLPCPSRNDAPLLAVQEYGKGRTGAFAGDGTWRWATGAGIADAAARDRAGDVHRRFWRQVVFWLARREERAGLTVNLELSRHRLPLGEKLQLKAAILDEELEPLTDAQLAVQIATDGREELRTFWLEGNDYKVDFEPPVAGDYGLRVTARRDGQKLSQATSAFTVTAADIELLTLVSRPTILAALSRATGAAFAPADNARHVLAQIAAGARSSRHVRIKRNELWSTWWYLSAVLALLALEWTLRKLAGLV